MIIEIQPGVKDTVDREILESKHDTQKALSRFNYDDKNDTARFMFQAAKAMAGVQIFLTPTIYAAEPPGPPKRPPPMKYTDLPLYKSPHHEYKDYVNNKHKCPKARVKLIHEFLYPHVSCFRKQVQKSYHDTRCAIQKTTKCVCTSFCESKRDFKTKMRCPDNILMRQSVLVLGGAVGYLIGGGRGIPRRLLFTGAGLLVTGALCFPEETDDAFRNLSYYTGKLLIGFYNLACKKGFSMRERVPCKDDLQPLPPPRTQNPCPKQ